MDANILYSHAILAFIARVKQMLKSILTAEVRVVVRSDRFQIGLSSYPLKIVIIEHQKILGYFNPGSYELGLNKQMMGASPTLLANLLRHELAHYLTWIKHGDHIPHHGKEYHDLCRLYGWGPDVYAATIEESLDDISIAVDEDGDRILSKIKKLLALATSQNQHESELATIKSNELLLKYNLSERELYRDPEGTDEELLLKRIFKHHKTSAKTHAIAQILRTFFVETVYSRGSDYVYLEIFGKKSNVAIAEYVGFFLENEFDRLWEHARNTQIGLKGLASKNSFYYGIAKGYCQKIEALNQMGGSEQTHGLIMIQNDLKEAAKMPYPSVRQTVSRNRHCPKAAQLGTQAGRNLQIKQGIEKGHPSGLCISMK